MLASNIRPTIFYFNPNIWPREEYEIRKNESKRHAESLGIRWIDGDYDHQSWCSGVVGLEGEPERGSRCQECFIIRLTATARKAQELGIPYFATTLASSRWKSLEQINRAGLIAQETVRSSLPPLSSLAAPLFWPQNWRKGGLQERRNQLLKEYNFYNQQYCGCEFSARNGANTKPLLRQQMRDTKRQHQAQLSRLSEEVVEKLIGILQASLSKKGVVETLLAYWPLPDEVDIRPLLDRLVQKGNTVLLPKVIDDERMELRRYTSAADLAEGPFHIMEPVGELFTDYEQINVALIPGMAFDAAGHRLGRGKGYYDRFFASHHSPLKIGVCFPFQRVAEVPVEDHDVSVDVVV
jgi:5,10-methenyltetrahydrofolate synthetase